MSVKAYRGRRRRGPRPAELLLSFVNYLWVLMLTHDSTATVRDEIMARQAIY